jgi:hypothetical protein
MEIDRVCFLSHRLDSFPNNSRVLFHSNLALLTKERNQAKEICSLNFRLMLVLSRSRDVWFSSDIRKCITFVSCNDGMVI